MTADLVLGQADLIHNQPNLVDSGSLFNVRNFTGQGVATDSLGHLYLSDTGHSRVLGWRNMSALVNGQAADLVLGQPDFLSSYCNQTLFGFGPSSNATLCGAAGLAVDKAGNLYVVDPGNLRVLEYNAPFNSCASFPCVGPAANLAIVGQCLFLDATTLCGPSGVAVDSSYNVYVADTNNNRVLEYNDPLGYGSPTVSGADLVFGQGASGTNFGANTCADGSVYKNPPPTSTALCQPTGVALDKSDNLYIADRQNSRVLEYKNPLASNPPNMTANLVFGQGSSGTNFGANTCAESIYGTPPPSATALCFPTNVAVDRSGNLYITDNTNSRVLEYNNPLGSSPPNVTANLVFGQGSSGNDFTANACTGLPPPPASSMMSLALRAYAFLRV